MRGTPTAPSPPAEAMPAARRRGIYRRRRLAAALVALAALVGMAFGIRVLLYDSGLFEVTGVDVSGAVSVGRDAVVGAADVQTGVPLAGVDLDAIAARVAALPAVASVRVTRSWPHTVAVTVVERVPVATVVTSSGVGLVDTGGTVYAGTAAPGLPRLVFAGVGPDDPSTHSALAALAALPPDVRAQVLTVDATVAGAGVPGQVTFGLTKDRQVRWGTPDRAADKAAVLVPLLTQPGHVYDVTSPDLPTIRR